MTKTITAGITSLLAAQTPVTYYDGNITGAFTTVPSRFASSTISLQVSGTASSFTLQVFRVDVSPGTSDYASVAANGAPITPLGGNSPVLTGAANNYNAQSFYEPGVGWWCVSVSSVTGGYINVSLSGVTI